MPKLIKEMAEYIEREALIKKLGVSACELYAKAVLREAPTADVVEVVRCKDCKYFKTSINKEDYCELHSAVWYKFYIRADDFCSYGKRGVNNG